MKTTQQSDQDIISDALWLPHRFDETARAFRFALCDRDIHRSVTFITDEYLPDDLEIHDIQASTVAQAKIDTVPVHFIFHSAYCCSTLLARAFDIPGTSMGLKEPVVLNDMIGWLRRGGNPQDVASTLDIVLNLLARPFPDDSAVVVKPSNIVNRLSPTMMSLRPDSKALLLYAPLEHYLRSIAKKDMWGRLWVRELFTGILQDRMLVVALSPEELLRLTDLQVAALGWLSQHSLFATLAAQYPERVRTLDSQTLLANKAVAMAELAKFFGVALTDAELDGVTHGPAFTTHSKSQESYSDADRDQEQVDAAALHAEEIRMVVAWAMEIAGSNRISLDLPRPLIDP